MIIYQVKNLNGSVGAQGGYWEYEFYRLSNDEVDHSVDLTVDFSEERSNIHASFSNNLRDGYGVYTSEVNRIGEF